MLKSKIRDKTNAGFTLIELLVAVLIFSIVITMIIQIFMISMGSSKNMLSRYNVVDPARFIMESISKELRMSSIQTVYLVADPNTPVDFASLDDGIYYNCHALVIFTGSVTELVYYNFDQSGGIDYIRRGITSDVAPNGADLNATSLNSDNVPTSGSFYVLKKGSQPPRVTFVLHIKNIITNNPKLKTQQINLQTTIASREYGH